MRGRRQRRQWANDIPAHPTPTPTILIASVGVWLLAYAAMTLSWISAQASHFWDGSVRRPIICCIGALMCQATGPALDRSASWPIVRRLGLAAGN
ncbi:MAG: hypothetical protein H7236_03945 [Gemmatimonadaceae bacterium]|nr:hypothetical protein [Caulobacter sp.]